MDDAPAAQVAQCQCQLAHIHGDGALREMHVLLQVVSEVSTQEQVYHHEHVLLVLEGVPANKEWSSQEAENQRTGALFDVTKGRADSGGPGGFCRSFNSISI